MAKETALMILVSLLLLQGGYGRPQSTIHVNNAVSLRVTTGQSDSEANREVKQKIANLKSSVYRDYSSLMDYILTKSEQLSKDVLADVDATVDKSNEEINRRRKLLSNALDKIDALKKLSRDEFEKQKWGIGLDLINVIHQFNIETKKNPTAEDRVFNDYFEKNNVVAVNQGMESKAKELYDKINVHINNFWSGLSFEEQTKYKALNDWHQKLEEESDPENKFRIIAELFIKNFYRFN